MFDSTIALLTYQAQRTLVTGIAPVRSGNRHASIAPYDTFATSDGTLVLAIGNDDQWVRFCKVVPLNPAARDKRFATNEGRVRHYEELQPFVADALSRESLETWLQRLRAAGVPVGGVRDIDAVLSDPQTAAREMVASVSHATIGELPVLGVPIKLSDTPGAVRTAPPVHGEHTRQVLTGDLGLTDADVTALAGRGVVKCS
jgi:crotonobetainyl-CoA:carnitine CoA-transferase CaiB-like acyl-CoA transferase